VHPPPTRSSLTTAETETYADAAALAKLIVDEPESAALAACVDGQRLVLVSSMIVRVEVTRAVRVSAEPARAGELQQLFDRVTFVPPDERLLVLAATLGDKRLRSLDAIHLASAVSYGTHQMLVYDQRLAEAAEAAGIRALSPGR
jgi:predicted nucleic acid-binding protein